MLHILGDNPWEFPIATDDAILGTSDYEIERFGHRSYIY